MSEYIIKNNNELPVYSRASKHYNMQLRLLNSNMRIQPEKNLHTSLLNENTPKEFWLLDVHPTLTKSTLINDYNLTIKDEVLMHKASATLLTLSNINR
jgi:hypothetical protein